MVQRPYLRIRGRRTQKLRGIEFCAVLLEQKKKTRPNSVDTSPRREHLNHALPEGKQQHQWSKLECHDLTTEGQSTLCL